MLGKTQAAFGTAAFGAAALAAGAAGCHLSAADLAVGTVVAAGSALAPDLDEARSMPGRALPLSYLPIFGGHRTRTHTLVAVGVVTGVAVGCSFGAVASGAFAGFMATMGAVWVAGWLRHKRHGALFVLAAGAAFGLAVANLVGGGPWLALAVGPAYASHLFGDSLTPGGVPFLMPASSHGWSVGWFRTGQLGEKVIVAPLVSIAAGVSLLLAASAVLGHGR